MNLRFIILFIPFITRNLQSREIVVNRFAAVFVSFYKCILYAALRLLLLLLLLLMTGLACFYGCQFKRRNGDQVGDHPSQPKSCFWPHRLGYCAHQVHSDRVSNYCAHCVRDRSIQHTFWCVFLNLYMFEEVKIAVSLVLTHHNVVDRLNLSRKSRVLWLDTLIVVAVFSASSYSFIVM